MYNFVLKEREREMIVIHGVQTFFEGEFLFQFKKKVTQSPNHSAASYLIFQVFLKRFETLKNIWLKKH